MIRHSAAHVLAQAVQDKFPDAKLGIGPPIRDGFYYDFDVARAVHPGRSGRPRQAHAQDHQVRPAVLPPGGRHRSTTPRPNWPREPYKLELVDLKSERRSGASDAEESVEVGAGELTIYDNLHAHTGDRVWGDLCRGPHVPTTRYIPAFKLTRSAAAYWRGNQANPQLQRIYGTAWESAEAQDAYLERLAEAERRDHRKLGTELDLFSFPDELGSGLAVFHPKGGILRRELEGYVRQRHIDEGFDFVNTPHISKEGLFHTSGHLPYYADGMFPPMEMEGSRYFLKAMNCPMHNLIYRSRGRSYRELPLRLFEFGSVYRNELSGVVHGLTRVRGMTQDDSHSYCTPEQAPEEIAKLLRFVLGLLARLRARRLLPGALHPGPVVRQVHRLGRGVGGGHRRAGTGGHRVRPGAGRRTRAAPRTTARRSPSSAGTRSAAPGRCRPSSTTSTSRPGSSLEYQASDGTRQQPVMIHSAKFGSIERFIGVLTEHYAGAFPAWLAPVQVVGIPVADAFGDHLEAVVDQLRGRGIRAEVDHSDDRMQKKIRTHTTGKVPFLLLAGAKDVEAGAVSFRFRDGTQVNGVPVGQAVDAIDGWIREPVQRLAQRGGVRLPGAAGGHRRGA